MMQGARARLALASVAVAFAAADTYVVVLALPEMMAGVGLGIDQLQRAAPIISGFLLGYIAVVPLIGRIADLTSPVPTLIGCLALFGFGSLVTASAYDLGWLVAGRFVQGVGGGGLIPVTLAMVAAAWPPDRRGLALGVVGAVQEAGSVLGPLLGAVILAVSSWRTIFWLNLVVAAVLLGALRLSVLRSGAQGPEPSQAVADSGRSRRWRAYALCLAAAVATAVLGLALRPPQALATSVTWGLPFVPLWGESVFTTPAFLLAVALFLGTALATVAWYRRPIAAVLGQIDLLGIGLLALALGALVIAFAATDPEHALLAPSGPWWLAAGAVAAVLFGVRQHTARTPAVPRGTLTARPAWGAIAASLFIGAGLVAALVDVPVFARLSGRDQFGAAMVLLRFLIGVPVGALAGGWGLRRAGVRLVTATGLALSVGAFLVMARWQTGTLGAWESYAELFVCGLGFGLAVAPVNDALLGATPRENHALASSLVIVARMVGMLVGISVLTALGLRAYYRAVDGLPPPAKLCPASPATGCAPYLAGLEHAAVEQVHTIFVAAAVSCLVAVTMCAATLGKRQQDSSTLPPASPSR